MFFKIKQNVSEADFFSVHGNLQINQAYEINNTVPC